MKFSNLKLKDQEVLQRGKLKFIYGGDMPREKCEDECQTNNDCKDPDHTMCITFNLIHSCPDKPMVKECV